MAQDQPISASDKSLPASRSAAGSRSVAAQGVTGGSRTAGSGGATPRAARGAQANSKTAASSQAPVAPPRSSASGAKAQKPNNRGGSRTVQPAASRSATAGGSAAGRGTSSAKPAAAAQRRAQPLDTRSAVSLGATKSVASTGTQSATPARAVTPVASSGAKNAVSSGAAGTAGAGAAKQLPVNSATSGAKNAAASSAVSKASTKTLGVGAVKDLARGASLKETGKNAAKSVAWKAGPQYGLAAEAAEVGAKKLQTPAEKRAEATGGPAPVLGVLAVPASGKKKKSAGGGDKQARSSKGSTSAASTSETDKGSTATKVGTAAAVGAVPTVGFVAGALALAAYLKSLFFTGAAMLVNALKALAQLAVTYAMMAASKAISAVLGIGQAVLNAGAFLTGGLLGGAASASAVTTAVTGAVTTAATFTVAGAMVTSLALGSPTLLEGRLDAGNTKCSVTSTNAVTASTASVSADTEKNAKIVYSVLSEMGMPDENIAGILGNWSQESGVDATSVEGIFSEPFSIGAQKKKAWDGNFTHIPGQQHGGIGLGQWSNGRTPMLLDFAKKNNQDWFAIDTQLAFMASGDNPSDVAVFKDMIANSKGSPEEAAKFFHDKWERSADNAAQMAERQADAKMWMGKLSTWDVDPSVTSKVKSMLSGMIASGASTVSLLNQKCDDSAAAGGVGSLQDGGVAMEEARKITELYNREGDQVLGAAFNGGGPGKCGGSYIQNCVSFSWYFIVKYTSYDKGYAPGNGVDTARSVASKMGTQTSKTPKAYSVFSNAVGSSEGHTGVVLGVEGERLIIGEASYCDHPGRVRWVEPGEWKSQNWEFVDMSGLVNKDSGLKDSASGSVQAAAAAMPVELLAAA